VTVSRTHTERAILIKELICAPVGTAAGAARVAAKLGVSVALPARSATT